MSKLKIKLVILGQLPLTLDKTKLTKWKSEVLELDSSIDNYPITNNADGENWEFTDDNILKLLPGNFEGNFLLAMTHVPLENNYYARRFSDNRICMTFYEMADLLTSDNIPLENLVYRLLYSYSLIYLRHGNKIPPQEEITNFTHDETRGCLFDMNGIKSDIIYSTDKPQLCGSCLHNLAKEKVPTNKLSIIQRELNKIKKPLYYRLADFIKSNPIWTFIISSLIAIILGVIGSLFASLIWEKFKAEKSTNAQQSVWHYGGWTLEQSTSVRYSSAVPA